MSEMLAMLKKIEGIVERIDERGKKERKNTIRKEKRTPADIDSLKLPVRIIKNLRAAGINAVDEIPISRKRLLAIKRIGPFSADAIDIAFPWR